MGLLGKAGAKSDTVLIENPAPVSIQAFSIDIQALIDRFHLKNPLFHCVLLQPANGEKRDFAEIAGMAGFHGIECAFLPNGNCLILLPGSLDADLFSHRLSKSSGSTVISQFSADSPSSAFEKIEMEN
ncbi:MAG: hypothetical protein LBU85_01445 [Treponema sp.]|jgi:hypothetical protein|nr:hypothetical protein [Treponema sp.]